IANRITLIESTVPMILPVHDRVRSRLSEAIASRYQLEGASLPNIVIETPPRRAFGDLAVPVAFELARTLRKAPRVIAGELADAVTGSGLPDGVARVEAAPNG